MVLVCNFSHLNTFSYKVDGILVRFSYSNHVFSAGKVEPLTPSHQFWDGKGNPRSFDEVRYQDSFLLETHLRNLPKQKIYDENHGNAFYFPRGAFVYKIVLSIKRDRKDVAVRIESAFRINTFPKHAHHQSMNFPVAVKRAYKGELIFPRKR